MVMRWKRDSFGSWSNSTYASVYAKLGSKVVSGEGQASLRTDGDEGRVGTIETLGDGALTPAAEGSLGSLASPSPVEVSPRLRPAPLPLGWKMLPERQGKDRRRGRRG